MSEIRDTPYGGFACIRLQPIDGDWVASISVDCENDAFTQAMATAAREILKLNLPTPPQDVRQKES